MKPVEGKNISQHIAAKNIFVKMFYEKRTFSPGTILVSLSHQLALDKRGHAHALFINIGPDGETPSKSPFRSVDEIGTELSTFFRERPLLRDSLSKALWERWPDHFSIVCRDGRRVRVKV